MYKNTSNQIELFHAIGFMGLPQFIAFLNQSNETNVSGPLTNSPRVDGRESSYARSRAGGGDVGSNAGTYTAIPRPRNSSSATGKRKSSFSSQFTESRISSQSMTPPETPRSGSGPKMMSSVDSKHLDPRLEASLASIASSGQSELSASDTLGRPENKQHVENGSAAKNGDRNAKPMSNSTSKLPKRAHSLRDSAPSTSPRQIRNTSRPTSSTPRKPPSQLLSNVEKHNSRGTQDTASSESKMAAAFTTLGNKTSKHGTNSDYLLIKPRYGTAHTRTCLIQPFSKVKSFFMQFSWSIAQGSNF